MNQPELTLLAEQVAEHLPGAWSVEPFPADWGRRGAWLRGEHGETLSIGETQDYSKRNKNQLDVGTDYPKEHRERGFSTKRPKISVSASKTGQQVASDIERRLLPDYLPLFEKVLQDLEQWRSYEETTSSLAAKIADLVEVPVPKNGTTVSFYHSPYPIFSETMSEARVMGKNEVELQLRLSPDDALTLLQIVLDSKTIRR